MGLLYLYLYIYYIAILLQLRVVRRITFQKFYRFSVELTSTAFSIAPGPLTISN